MSELIFKIADRDAEFEAIHALNYRTFVEEIPQHPANPERRLVDAFHDQNTYAICLDGDRVVGMIAGRGQRPFSLDRKLPGLDNHLPPHRKAVEVRLLAVEPAYRKTDVFARLIALLAERFAGEGYDLGLISGTLRQLKLYAHLGFTAFGPQVGTRDAPYQPMFLDLAAFQRLAPKLAQLPAQRSLVNLLPGPVSISEEVKTAFKDPPLSHRCAAFMRMHRETREALCCMTGADEAILLTGSGTLANEAVAAQISLWPGRGLILVNGEFGDRLENHACRWGLRFDVLRHPWGKSFNLDAVDSFLDQQPDIRWIWAVACETSTGILNPVSELVRRCASRQIDLCIDAVSAVGSGPLDLAGVRLASSVSGKALGAYPGLAIVLASGPLAEPGNLPNYLDLAGYVNANGVPFTLSSNLLSALHASLTRTDWEAKYGRISRSSDYLRRQLRSRGFAILAEDRIAAPAVITLPLPSEVKAQSLCRRMKRAGYLLAYESAYLKERNWVQICLMGDLAEDDLHDLPELLALQRHELEQPKQRLWDLMESMPCGLSAHC